MTAPHRDSRHEWVTHPSLGFLPEDTAGIHNTFPRWWGNLQTTTFTTQVHSHTCPTMFRVPCLGTNGMRHANRVISNAPSVHCAAIIEDFGRAANLVTKASSRTHANMQDKQLNDYGYSTTKQGANIYGHRRKRLESRFTSTMFYCFYFTFIYNVKVFQNEEKKEYWKGLGVVKKPTDINRTEPVNRHRES